MREILLHGAKAAGRIALVDDEDYDLVNQYRWYLSTGHGEYARSIMWRRGPNITMHKLITGYPLTDHRNGNGLDNRRTNLRPATHRQNQYNKGKQSRPASSPYKGVRFCKQTGRWQTSIRENGCHRWIGRFDTPEDAARAYDKVARELHGEFARLNFPGGAVI